MTEYNFKRFSNTNIYNFNSNIELSLSFMCTTKAINKTKKEKRTNQKNESEKKTVNEIRSNDTWPVTWVVDGIIHKHII